MPADWVIDGITITDLESSIRTWDSITLTFEIEASDITSIRALENNVNKYEVIPYPSGDYRAIDRTADGSSNTYTIQPPDVINDLRVLDTGLLADYQDQILDQRSDVFEVTLEFIIDENVDPEDDTQPRHSDDNDLWYLELSAGDILTRRVSFDIGTKGSASTIKQMILLLEREEAITWEHSASRLGAIYIRESDDGPDEVIDRSSDSVNTVNISPPTGGDFSSGNYVISEWESRWLNDSFYEIAATLHAT